MLSRISHVAWSKQTESASREAAARLSGRKPRQVRPAGVTSSPTQTRANRGNARVAGACIGCLSHYAKRLRDARGRGTA